MAIMRTPGYDEIEAKPSLADENTAAAASRGWRVQKHTVNTAIMIWLDRKSSMT